MTNSILVLGEYRRVVDDRYRLSIPNEILDGLELGDGNAVLAKERPGCLSVWNREKWNTRLDSNLQIIESKLKAKGISDKPENLQRLGRLLSTRHRDIQVAARGRIVIPEGFREFLMVDAGSELLIVGAAICIEIWSLDAWRECLRDEIAGFNSLMDELAG